MIYDIKNTKKVKNSCAYLLIGFWREIENLIYPRLRVYTFFPTFSRFFTVICFRVLTNYIPSKVGGPEMSTFCQRSYHRKCQRRGVGGQKKPKSCQRSL